MYDAMMAETVTISGDGGDEIPAYFARPLGPGPHGGVVVIHHLPGWDAWSKEVARTFAVHGYLAICPNLHHRDAPDVAPEETMAVMMAKGGVPDDRLVGDVAGAAASPPASSSSNGKVGVIGYCSGGRQSFLAACRLPFDAAVDCYGAFVAEAPPPNIPLKMKPIIGLASDLSCPLLGLFGAEDMSPAPAETAKIDEALTALGKPHEFHTFEGAGHAFFAVDRPSYRQHAAAEGWPMIWEWFGRYLAA